jgi:chemotaxis protein CheD
MNSGDLLIKPGELFFGSRGGRVKTILGSCVALTLWHPQRRLGGMCHYVLPTRGGAEQLDARYGDEALAILLEAARAADTRIGAYQVGLFGGGNMFPDVNMATGRRIGEQNVALARELVRRYGLRVTQEDVGSHFHRHVTLDLRDGALSVRATEVQRS